MNLGVVNPPEYLDPLKSLKNSKEFVESRRYHPYVWGLSTQEYRDSFLGLAQAILKSHTSTKNSP